MNPEDAYLALYQGEPDSKYPSVNEIRYTYYRRVPAKVLVSPDARGLVVHFVGTWQAGYENWQFDHCALLTRSGILLRAKPLEAPVYIRAHGSFDLTYEVVMVSA